MTKADSFDPPVGVAMPLAPGLRRILAPNPSPMTYRGTNTYLLGRAEVTVIDPGPAAPAHQQAILDALAPGERIVAILVTHSHRDHSGLARSLSAVTGAPVAAFGPSSAGRSPTMERLAQEGDIGGGEGVDPEFRPDRLLADGAHMSVEGEALEALWTPGHMGNHLCFAWRDLIFTGDLAMGWSTTLISPPDGDLEAFMASCRRLRMRAVRRLLPGHGAPVDAAVPRLDELIRHREARTEQVIAALEQGAADLPTLTRRVYRDLDEVLMPAASRNMLAHLIWLVEQGRAAAEPAPGPAAKFTPRNP